MREGRVRPPTHYKKRLIERAMKIICEKSLENFEAWSGGKDTMDALSHSDLEKLEQHLEELNPDGMTDTELNDFLWFERDTIADLLGYRNADAMFDQDDEDWEDHYRTILNEEYDEEFEDLIDEWVSDESSENMSDKEVKEQFQQYVEDHLEEEEDEDGE